MQSDEMLPARKKTPAWKIAVNIVFFLGLLAVFAWQLQQNWVEIQKHHWSMHWGLAATALGLLLICSLLDFFLWNATLGWFTEPLPFRRLVPVFIWSYLGRYIPGKVGSLLLRVALAAEAGRRAVPVLASSAVELALRTASALLLFILVLPGWGATQHGNLTKITLGALGIIPVVMICAHPRIMLPVMNWLLMKINKPPIERRLRYRDILGIFFAEFFRWVIYGLALYTLAWSVYPAARGHLLALEGAAAGAWAAGFIGMAPGGIGVTEGVMSVCLRSLKYPNAIFLILPVIMRLWTLIAEGLWALAAFGLWRTAPVARQMPVVETEV